jgi:C4-dicarboxylate-specific signal transduction histidine kinase
MVALCRATTSASFSDLPAGKHYFQVRAMDRAGNIDPDPAELDFAMVLPWYKESRLVLIASAGAAAAAFFAVLAWRRHRELALSYAQVEKQVAERTRELELANQELLQSQKMRALGTLAAGIAHDFNNILSIVKGSAQIIEDNLADPEKIRTRADRIKTVVNQGSAVVQAMLGFSRGSDEMLEDCEINPVVDNTLKLLGDRFLREVELRFERAPDSAACAPPKVWSSRFCSTSFSTRPNP